MSLLHIYNTATEAVHGLTWAVQAQICTASCEPMATNLRSSGAYDNTDHGVLLQFNDRQDGEC